MKSLPDISTSHSGRATGSPGAIIRKWRQHRRFSQMALALETGISTRHLSFLESGRAGASRETLLRLADHLDLPHRERNALLLAAGFAPQFGERPLHDPALTGVREAIRTVLRSIEPSPALVVDRQWNLIEANRTVAPLLAGVAHELLQPPVNVLRLALHSQGLAPRIENLHAWRRHLLQRLAREVEVTADPGLARLLHELRAYRAHAPEDPADDDAAALFVPLRLRVPGGVLSLISTTTVFGTAADATVTELTIESFLPADTSTAEALRAAAASACAEEAAVRTAARPHAG